MRKLVVLAMLVSMPFFALASGDHAEKEFITGSGIELTHVNEILVGTVGVLPVWAEKVCGSHLRGMYKKGEELLNFEVIIKDKKITGTFGDQVISFAKMVGSNPETRERSFLLKTGDLEIPVSITYEKLDEAHMVNIDFTFEREGKTHNIKLEGEGCMGSVIFYSIFFYGALGL